MNMKSPSFGRPKPRPRGPKPGPGKPRKSHQQGVTLFELLLVLFVAAFVAVAVATIYNRVNTTYKENVLFNDVQQLAANIRSIYGSSVNYAGLDSDVVVAAQIAPDSMISGTTRITPFYNAGNTWEVAEAANGDEFTITISNLPVSVCTGMAGKGLGVATSVATGGTVATDVGALAAGCAGGVVALTYN